MSDRIWTRIEPTPFGCWIWRGPLTRKGYGRVQVERKNRWAHRVVYELLVGPIPEGLVIDHLCRNRACLNPAHMEPVTIAENTMRGDNLVAVNARKTHCKRGHEFTPENTAVDPKTGQRKCRTCRNDQQRARAGRPSLGASSADTPSLLLPAVGAPMFSDPRPRASSARVAAHKAARSPHE